MSRKKIHLTVDTSVPQFEVDDVQSLHSLTSPSRGQPMVSTTSSQFHEDDKGYLTPMDPKRLSWLAEPLNAEALRPGSLRSRSRSRSRSSHSRSSPGSPSGLAESTSRRLSSNRSLYEDAKEDISFINKLADDDDLSALKADLRSALGDGKNMSGAWLTAPDALASSSKSMNSSKASLIPGEEEGYELQSLKSPNKSSLFLDIPNNDSQSAMGPPSPHTLYSPRPDTVEGVFRQFTSKINQKRQQKSPYLRTPIPEESIFSDNEFSPRPSTHEPSPPSPLPQDPPLILYGHSLRFFAPYSRLRNTLATYLIKEWVDYGMKVILLLQTIILAYKQWDPYARKDYIIFGATWADWAHVAINVVFTIEMIAKIIAWGFWDDSEMFQAMDMEYLPISHLLRLHSVKNFIMGGQDKNDEKQFKHSVTFRKPTMRPPGPIHRAFMRSGWNRVDFVSTVCFWINLFLTIDNVNAKQHITLFRALECLRIIRLVNLTDRISLILRSMKNGAPQLMDVGLFILYFWALFAIIGTQSFKSSFRRYCVWVNPDNDLETYQTDQHCGGYYVQDSDGNLQRKPYIMSNGAYASASKGFLCPVNSECRELENPENNMYSFDNILNSMQLTFVVMSANTFSNIMYDTMDTDTMAASIYFIFGIFILFLWMTNLLVAVISAAFKSTRDAAKMGKVVEEFKEDFDLDFHFRKWWLSKLYIYFYAVCDLLIFVSIAISCRRDKNSTDKELRWEYAGQSVISYVLFVEIIVRFFAYFPKWRMFFKLKRNDCDVFLAVATIIMAIPPLHTAMGRGYDWMRAFHMLRFYRCVLRIGFVRRLWARVWRNINTIINLSLFYFLFLFLCSIIFSRYFEGFVSSEDLEDYDFPMNTLSNVFLALYVITTTENWSDIMYSMQAAAPNKSAALFSGILFIMWFILSNSIILAIFIAIIGDSLEVSEKLKRKEQVKKFILVDFPKKLKLLAEGTVLSELRSRFFGSEDQDQKHREVEKLLLNGAAVQAFLKDEVEGEESRNITEEDRDLRTLSTNPIVRFFQRSIRYLFSYEFPRKVRGYFLWHTYGTHRNPFFKGNFNFANSNYTSLAENFQVETEKTIEERIKFLKQNPGFNTSLFILRPNQPMRRLCQYITKPSVGKRYDGVEPNKYANMIFMMLISASTLALVIVACYSTPLYRKNHHFDSETWNWTLVVELTFGVLFALEFSIKIIADGFLFTPNAYMQNSWNHIDLVVLLSIWINVIAIMKNDENLSRVVRGLKALRALRILTISETSKDIFHKVIIAGVWKILGAAFLSFLLIFPFAAWGLNLFTGRLGACNDSVFGYSGCVNEYGGEVFKWDVLMPRAYIEPQLELNRYASALLTLFEVISMEGWTDLLQNMVNSTGVRTPQGYYATTSNAVFLVLFIFVGIVFVLTLFISVIISNYAMLSGSAFLTLQQTSWNEVKKLLSQIRPRKRPDRNNLGQVRTFCYNYAVDRPRWLKLSMQFVLWTHVLAILLEKFPSPEALDNFRYSIYTISSTIFMIWVLMRLVAIGPKTFFKVRWNVYELIVFVGAFATSLSSFFYSRSSSFAQINKLFLVGIFTVLIHQSNRLSHLLKIASASLPSLLSLIFTWAILFLVYAIALNQIFGLTRLGPNTTGNQNLRTVTKALLLLFKNSFGEGWNYTMRDFAVVSPYCVDSGVFNSTDCGNTQYAYILFISWNILSMYIFVNMFVSLIFENFSYVYTDNSGSVSLNREEIRTFKTMWSKFDPDGTGYISLDDLPRFLRSLEGYFSFKVFEGKWTIPELKKEFIEKKPGAESPYDVNVNIRGLNRMMSQMDVARARQRTIMYERFIEEAKFNMERYDEKGVSFHRLILQIPLYARFDETRCLTLTDFLDRLVVTRRLNERMEYRRRYETLRMICSRWKFLRLKGKKFSSVHPKFEFEEFDEDNNSILASPFFKPGGDFATPRSSLSRSQHTNEAYWSPERGGRGPVRSNTEIMDELADISGALEHSQWKNEFKDVGNEIDEALSRTKTANREREETPSSDDVEEQLFEFDYDVQTKGSQSERKIT